MASDAHDILVTAIRNQPEWLESLLAATGRRPVGPDLHPVDSTLRMVASVEVRPDIVLAGGDPARWTIVEVQLKVDDEKRWRWMLAVALMMNEQRSIGDLVVITHSRAVARWSSRAVKFRSSGGTEVAMSPVVVLLTAREASALLATGETRVGTLRRVGSSRPPRTRSR